MTKFERFSNSKLSGLILNLFLPGAGHVYFREYTFGLFIFLVWLIAAVLFYLSFMIDLGFWVRVLLFGLPVIFYFFTFFDLINSLNKKKEIKTRAVFVSVVIFLIALSYQIFSPTAPANFAILNGPQIFVLDNNHLSPIYSQGTVMKASRLAYRLEIAGFSRPILHHLPDRYEIIRFEDDNNNKHSAVVLGLPGEAVEMSEGTLIINGLPDFEGWIGGLTFTSSYPEVLVGNTEILAASLNLGVIDRTFKIPISQVIGRVEPFFE